MVTAMSGQSALTLEAEREFEFAVVRLVKVQHRGPRDNVFRRLGVFWIDLCLTPRRPSASARYVDHWGKHRFSPIGSIMALPPDERLHLKSAGGSHGSVICQLQAEAVQRHLSPGFKWTDRRLEACLQISSEPIRWLLQRLGQEMRNPRLSANAMCEAIVAQLAIELARYIESVDEPAERGGLAPWRLRLIDERLAEPREPPSLAELARLCALSIRQLTRGFRASRGCSVADYLAQVRVDAVKRRLITDQSIKSIATELGYSNQSNFTSAFRRATGTTPKVYRDRIRSARTSP
jgi:AraC family transcriptional regulator